MPDRIASRLVATGRVQGVGFRPSVFRLAEAQGLSGSVQNTPRGVEILIEGPPGAVKAFAARLRAGLPPVARLAALTEEPLPPENRRGFRILPSVQQDADGSARALIPSDLATCPACLAELDAPGDRRHAYPFINCTLCGPRYTIIEAVPYDRARTSMRAFRMCARCQAEYDDPGDRRHHAQPNACPACGPRLWLADKGGAELAGPVIEAARALLREGRVLAVRGVGGFHLAVDALNPAAVEALRARKRRGPKPFAVLAPDLEAVGRLARVSAREAGLLAGVERPIVLLEKAAPCPLAEAVAPGNPRVGAMLPHSPLQHLLARGFEALVMTSGNLAEEPIARENEEALARLVGLADAFLLHDRDILMACDDSVTRLRPPRAGRPAEDELVLVRRSRGYAPDPLPFPAGGPAVLAVGAELKNTFCLTRGEQAFLSQHVGDLENLETEEHFHRCLAHLERLLGVEPRVLACDLHPDYLSTRLAEELARARPGLRLVRVQHHHAHLAACLCEHGLPGPALGVCLDGVGLGTDGSLWGGEILVGDESGFERGARLRPFRLPGGDAAAREPWRVASSLLLEVFGADAPFELLGPDADRAAQAARACLAGVNAPWTSSLGRLFDGVAALLGLCRVQAFDAEAPMRLEAAAGSRPGPGWPVSLTRADQLWELDFSPMVQKLLAGRARGQPAEELAAGFHAWCGAGLAEICRLMREAGAPARAALSGGCLLNQRLEAGLVDGLEALGFEVLIHRRVPANDGGLCLGQAVVAAVRCRAEG
jgi:hydrogenase maturation protein HypF